MLPHRPAGCILGAGVAGVVFLSWMLFPVWPRRTFSVIIRYLLSGPTRDRFELCSPSWRIYGLAWKQKQPLRTCRRNHFPVTV